MPETLSQPSARRRWRCAVPAALLVALVTVLAACGSDDPTALTVGPTEISTKTVNDELNTIAKNKILKSQATVKGKIRPEIAASWLTTDVEIAVAKQAVQKAKGDANDKDRAQALNWAHEHFGSDAAYNAFPDWFKVRILGQYAFIPAYVRMHSKTPTEQDMRNAYTSSLSTNCGSKRYVFRIVVPSEAQAQQVAAQVAAGTDFSQVAAQVSTDTSSKQQGGAMGCLDSAQQQVDPTFLAQANATPIGSVSAPFQGAEGWQVVKVQDVGTVLAYDKVKSEIKSTLQYGDEGRSALTKLMAGTKVKVDPQFGRWVVQQGVGQIQPPKSAKSSTTTTAPAGASTTTTSKP